MSALPRLKLFDAFFQEVHRTIVQDTIRNSPALKALDIGCGAGGMAVLLAEALPQGLVAALDTNKEHLRHTRDAAVDAGFANFLICMSGDVENLQFIAGEFDLIWCSRVIHHHLPDPRVALSEMYRVLKVGGRLLLRENTHGSLRVANLPLPFDEALWDRLGMAQQRWFQSKFRHRRPPVEDWTDWILQAGFAMVEAAEFPYIAAAPAVQLSYLKDWVEGILEDDRSPEHGDLLTADDRRTTRELVRYLEGINPGDLQVRVITHIFTAIK